MAQKFHEIQLPKTSKNDFGILKIANNPAITITNGVLDINLPQGAALAHTFGDSATTGMSQRGASALISPSLDPTKIGIGTGSQSSGTQTIAIGQNTNASGEYSVALGSHAISNALCTLAIGQGASASGNTSIAVGRGANASGAYSMAFGNNTVVTAENSVAFGPEISLTSSETNLFHVGNKRIAGVNNPVNGTDAVNLQYFNANKEGGNVSMTRHITKDNSSLVGKRPSPNDFG